MILGPRLTLLAKDGSPYASPDSPVEAGDDPVQCAPGQSGQLEVAVVRKGADSPIVPHGDTANRPLPSDSMVIRRVQMVLEKLHQEVWNERW